MHCVQYIWNIDIMQARARRLERKMEEDQVRRTLRYLTKYISARSRWFHGSEFKLRRRRVRRCRLRGRSAAGTRQSPGIHSQAQAQPCLLAAVSAHGRRYSRMEAPG